MEPTPKTNPRIKKTEEEIDLGQLFYKTGGVINNLISGIQKIIKAVFFALLSSLFFLKRNLIWLALGTLIGLGYGIYTSITSGQKYTSELTVKANFQSTRALYGAIDYFNSLINNAKVDELSKVLNITKEEAASLLYMEAAPVKSELIVTELYQNIFLNEERNRNFRMDTFWVRTMPYKEFKASLTKYDYPIHEISVMSTSPTIFPRIQRGIIDKISSNELFQQLKSSDAEANKQEIDIITSSIQSLDTLRNTYNKRLAATPAEPKNTSVTLMDGNAATRVPELDLYDKLLELKDELKVAKNRSVSENEIIQIYSPFSDVGQRESFFKQSIARYSLMALIVTLFALVFIQFYKYLTALENEHAERGRNKTSRH